jgi:2'-5' RNA ligase
VRLFVAVVPPTDVLEHLEAALTSVRGGQGESPGRGSLRWTLPDDRHLTLAFFGEVPDGALEDLAEGLVTAAAGEPPLELALRGAGSFDRRTLWIGCAGDTDGLARLSARCVDAGTEVLGRPRDRVRSRAHLTVARARTGSAGGRPRRGSALETTSAGQDPVSGFAHALAVYQGPTWTVHDIALVSSLLGAGPSGHPRHEVLATLPLGPVAG